jgi:hypothetical protein
LGFRLSQSFLRRPDGALRVRNQLVRNRFGLRAIWQGKALDGLLNPGKVYGAVFVAGD